MVRLTVSTSSEYIFFSEATLPQSEPILQALPRRSAELSRTLRLPLGEEERKAQAMNLLGLHYAARRGYAIDPQRPLETWIVGPPTTPRARFSEWFLGAGESYRLLVHRYNLSGASEIEDMQRAFTCWDNAYERLGVSRRRMPGNHLTNSVKVFLKAIAEAYDHHSSSLTTLFHETGHSFAHARLPERGHSSQLCSTS